MTGIYISGNILVAILCAILAGSKKRSIIGWFILGLFFNIISFIILAFTKPLNRY